MDDEEIEVHLPSGGGGLGGRGRAPGLPRMPPGMPKGLQDSLKDITKSIASSPKRGGGGPGGGVDGPFGGGPFGGGPFGGIVIDMSEAGPGWSPSAKQRGEEGATSARGGGGGGGGKDDGREKVRAGEALKRWEEVEVEEALGDLDVDAEAIRAAEERGIIFVDEVDKLVSSGRDGGGRREVKGEGVQKELLALLEGTSVRTPRGLVSTRHVLFICAGAFHLAKPSELLPELQGRLPVRVALQPLTEADFVLILRDTQFNLLMQQQKLLATEGVHLNFTDDAVAAVARLAAQVNASVENIGARRLRTVIAKLMEEISFTAHRLSGTEVVIDRAYVMAHTGDMSTESDARQYIL